MGIADDKLEIWDLVARYSHAFDGGNAADFAAVFTADGELVERLGGREYPLASGRDALMRFIGSKVKERGEKQPRHHVRNTVFAEFDADYARTRTYFAATVVDKAGERPYLTDTGIFEDAVVRTPQGWRIKKRVVIYDKHLKPGL